MHAPPSLLTSLARLDLSPAATPLHGSVTLPGSKSYSNRALLLAALASGESQLRGVLRADDTFWCLQALSALGVAVQRVDDCVTVSGVGGCWPRPGPVYLGSAGTLARFLPGLLAAAPAGGPWLLDGSPQLRRRPLQGGLAALGQLGARLQPASPTASLPLQIAAGGLTGGVVELRADVSSQFLSGLLLAAPLARQPVVVRVDGPIVQPAYVEMTLNMMRQYGVEVTGRVGQTALTVVPQAYRAASLQLEADASTAGYFFALAAATAGSLTVTNIGRASLQPDLALLDVLVQMGCRVDATAPGIRVTGPSQLLGGFSVDLQAFADQAPTVAVLAALATAPIRLTGIGHIRHHESDRIAAMAFVLTRLGAQVQVHADGLTVGPGRLQGAHLPTYGDHRIAMALAVLAARLPGIGLLEPDCVGKTCPDFFSRLAALGVGLVPIEKK